MAMRFIHIAAQIKIYDNFKLRSLTQANGLHTATNMLYYINVPFLKFQKIVLMS